VHEALKARRERELAKAKPEAQLQLEFVKCRLSLNETSCFMVFVVQSLQLLNLGFGQQSFSVGYHHGYFVAFVQTLGLACSSQAFVDYPFSCPFVQGLPSFIPSCSSHPHRMNKRHKGK